MMNDTAIIERLLDCFRVAFPEATDTELESATAASFPAWDSIAHVTLVTLVEEEFGMLLPPDKVGELNSFQAFLDLVDK
jgi:acyl carrier protein